MPLHHLRRAYGDSPDSHFGTSSQKDMLVSGRDGKAAKLYGTHEHEC